MVRRIVSVIMALGLLATSLAAVAAQPADPQEGCDYFEATGHNLCEPFLGYWNDNGGLPVFGYPKTEAAEELNPDLQQMLLSQWFERERLEHHPANAGTPYEILLGRLGDEVLMLMGRNWHAFPKGDPNADHYFPETGHAIAPVFWDYWSSHGLDLGDEGISFAESLALFGMPLSEAAVETNSSGDTVLTQWFERARFEHHPDNPEEHQILLGLLGNEYMELSEEPPPPPPPAGEVIADGLNNPRGIDVTPGGTVYVAEAGVGGDECITIPDEDEGEFELCFGDTGQVTQIAGGVQSVALGGMRSYGFSEEEFVGPQDVVADNGQLYVTIGLGADPEERDALGDLTGDLGWIVTGPVGGDATRVVDIAAYEGLANPDEGFIDSNPYSLTMDGAGGWVVSDAGGNDLLHVDDEGNITTLAVFPPQLVEAPPFLGLPPGTEIPMESVPTGVTMGSDGAFYVGELTGFPFVPGMARVWRVTADGETEVYADGFTNIIDVGFDSAGNLYVLEMVAGGLLNADPEDPSSFASRVVRVAPDGTQTVAVDVDEGLFFATGLAVGSDGTIYVSNFGVMPGMGQVVAFEGEGPPPVGEVIADGLNSPRGIGFGPDGTVYVAEAGIGGSDCVTIPGEGDEEDIELCFGDSGQVTQIADGVQSVAIGGLRSLELFEGESLGPHDVVVAEGGLYVMMGGLGPFTPLRDDLAAQAGQLGWLLMVDAEGGITPVADVTGYEFDANPDGGEIDSNPFSLVMDGAGGWVVSDAGMNALVHIDDEGTFSTLAVFEDRLVPAPPFLGLPDGTEIPMQAVPTGVTMGSDGAFYVGELTGFPFVPGMARVWRVTADGETEVYADGFTNIIDVAFDSAGNLYVLEMTAGGLLAADPGNPASLASRITQVAPDGTQTVVVDTDGGLLFATGMAIGPDGALYVSNFGVMPEMGQVVRIEMD